MNWYSALLMSSLLFGMPASSSSQGVTDAPSSERPIDGRVLYVTHCASCHGTSGRGDGPVADSLRRTPADLTQYAGRNRDVFPFAPLERIIDGRDVRAHGTVEMPVWGDVFLRTPNGSAAAVRDRIDALVRYLESIQIRRGE